MRSRLLGLLLLVSAAVPAFAQSSVFIPPARRVVRGAGEPSSGACAGLGDVGTIYIVMDLAAANTPLRICANTGSGTYGWVASGSSGAGTGDVTASGTLTASRIILGNGTTSVTALGSLGTTTTVLHGNAAGAPSFGAIVTADITDAQVTYAKIQNVSQTDVLLGRDTTGAGVIEEITPANARTLLGLVIGTNVQAFDADLSTYAGITPSANVQTFLGAANYAAMRTQLTLVVGTDVQAFDAQLTALSATPTDDNIPVGSGTDWVYKALPDCVDTGGNHINYTAATNAFSCGTSGGAGGGAPTDATYITQTANGTLSAEQALGALATGILKNTTTTGVLSIAVAGDFPTLNQNTTGNSATATALAANGGNCSGQVSLGVDASGVCEGTATPTLGAAGSVLGTLALAGNTSGTVTIRPAAAAGTWTLQLPADDGTVGQFLRTDGAGVTTWVTASGTGDFVGPASSTDNAIVRFDSTTGKLGQNSVVTIDDNGNLVVGNDGQASLTITFKTSGSSDCVLTATDGDLATGCTFTLTGTAGPLLMTEIASPSAPGTANQHYIYFDDDGLLKHIENGGAEIVFATISDTQTLTNKTLTSPVINVTSDATGDIYYRSAGGVFTRLAIGASTTVLHGGTIPAWSAIVDGDVPDTITLTNITQITNRAFSDLSGYGTGVSTFLATPSSSNFAAAVTGETGSGAVVFGTAPTIDAAVLTTIVTLPSATAPTIDAVGKIALDTNLWGSGRGAALVHDGTASTALIGVLVSDTPSNGQVPKWNTDGTITWEADSGGGVGCVTGGSDNQILTDDGLTGCVSEGQWTIASNVLTGGASASVSINSGAFTISSAGAVVADNISFGADPADLGSIRCSNNSRCMAWEAATPGTDIYILVNSSDQFVFSASILSPTLITPVLGAAAATSIAFGADPADAGAIRCSNNTVCMGWEAATPGTDLTISLNASDQLVITPAILSPTFITPALGTPASGVVTNLSGTLTNIVYNSEGTGNTLTTVSKTSFMAAGGTAAAPYLLWNTLAANAPTAVCAAGATETTLLDCYASFADADGDVSIQNSFFWPDDWTAANVDLKFKWKAAATTGDVVWQATLVCRADAEINDAAFNTANATAADTAKGTTLQLNDVSITGMTLTGCAAGELATLKVFRNRTHASDSITGTVLLEGVEMTSRRAQ